MTTFNRTHSLSLWQNNLTHRHNTLGKIVWYKCVCVNTNVSNTNVYEYERARLWMGIIMNVYECVWMCMNVYEWVWMGMNVYEWVWIRIDVNVHENECV